jgi:tetratricopeptide (TPR) repeat protein
MLRRALEAREKVLGREHPNTLISVNNLGSVLDKQGKFEEAEAMHRRALAAREKVLGHEHVPVDVSLPLLHISLAWRALSQG